MTAAQPPPAPVVPLLPRVVPLLEPPQPVSSIAAPKTPEEAEVVVRRYVPETVHRTTAAGQGR